MAWNIVNILAPDYCCGCGYIGDILCASCYNDIVSEPFDACVACAKPTGLTGGCRSCATPYSKAYVIGWREGVLKSLINTSKFDSVARGCRVQARLLNDILPELPTEAVVVPVPTTSPHIRQRGYGHIEKVARSLAQTRNKPYLPVLIRKQHSVQHGVSLQKRLEQAKRSYSTKVRLDPAVVYILVDDVYTTGATAKYASLALKRAGATKVWLAVTARQPLD